MGLGKVAPAPVIGAVRAPAEGDRSPEEQPTPASAITGSQRHAERNTVPSSPRVVLAGKLAPSGADRETAGTNYDAGCPVLRRWTSLLARDGLPVGLERREPRFDQLHHFLRQRSVLELPGHLLGVG